MQSTTFARGKPNTDTLSVQERIFGRPALSLAKVSQRRRGIIYHAEPFRIGRDWVLRATVQVEGVLIHGVLASSGGVAWPTKLGEPVIDFVDAGLMERAEAALKARAEALSATRQKGGGQRR